MYRRSHSAHAQPQAEVPLLRHDSGPSGGGEVWPAGSGGVGSDSTSSSGTSAGSSPYSQMSDVLLDWYIKKWPGVIQKLFMRLTSSYFPSSVTHVCRSSFAMDCPFLYSELNGNVVGTFHCRMAKPCVPPMCSSVFKEHFNQKAQCLMRYCQVFLWIFHVNIILLD